MKRTAHRLTIIGQLAQRDGHYCHYCGMVLHSLKGDSRARVGGRNVPIHRTECRIDHKVPRAHGGADDLANLLLTCACCNEHRGKMPYDRYLAWMREWKARSYWPAMLNELLIQHDYAEVWR